LARAERALIEARSAPDPADPRAKSALATAEDLVNALRKAADVANADARKLTFHYAPLTPIYPATSTGRRLALARWIADRRNPLAARVAVNHVWMRHFGRPLVDTVFDFGRNGRPPTHPALLDWLAVEFMDRGWSMKALHRLIVTSSAYQMQSTGGAGNPNAAVDGSNAYYWR